jgi:formylmethanofuran dehydrogenase subunit B
MLATLRARAAGRPVAGKPARALDALATELRQARFGVALWTAAALETPVIEMVCGLVDDLNAATRFTGLALAPDDNAAGVLQVCGWTTGFPMRTGFARGRAEHDPWRHDAARLVASRETDCVLWISAYGAALPDWDVPMIALTAVADDGRTTPRVRIAVGRPGVDHDAVEHLAATDTLVHRVASNPSDTISVAQALARIASTLPDIRHADAH